MERFAGTPVDAGNPTAGPREFRCIARVDLRCKPLDGFCKAHALAGVELDLLTQRAMPPRHLGHHDNTSLVLVRDVLDLMFEYSAAAVQALSRHVTSP